MAARLALLFYHYCSGALPLYKLAILHRMRQSLGATAVLCSITLVVRCWLLQIWHSNKLSNHRVDRSSRPFNNWLSECTSI